MDQTNQFLAALLFGAVIILFFAWDQFKRPSFDKSRDLARLIDILTPLDMRNRMAFWRAYLFYAGILILIYIVLNAYGSVLAFALPGFGEATDAPVSAGAGLLPTSGEAGPVQIAGYSPEGIVAGTQLLSDGTAGGAGGDGAGHNNPIVPLTISLAMVGLAPSTPFLLRIEEKIRFAAHRLSGIPTRLISSSQHLRRKSLKLSRDDAPALVSENDWTRIDAYLTHSRAALEDADTFREDLIKIFSFRAWFLQNRLPTRNGPARITFNAIEANLDKQIDKLVSDLDALLLLGAGQDDASRPQVIATWARHADEAATISMDIMVLYMLFVEHGILPSKNATDLKTWMGPAVQDSGNSVIQMRMAQELLLDFVSSGAQHADRDGLTATVWFRATVTIAILGFVFGFIWPIDSVDEGPDSSSFFGTNAFLLASSYMIGSIIGYALPLLVALGYQQAAYYNDGWRNAFDMHWSRWMFQYAGVALVAGSVALLCHVGYNIYSAAAAVTWGTVLQHWNGVVYYAFLLDGPKGIRGMTLAVIVVLLIDAWRSTRLDKKWLDWFPWISALVLCTVSAAVRVLINAGSLDADTEFSWSGALPLMLNAGVLAALIGFGTALIVRATLVHEYGSNAADAPLREVST